MPPTKVMVSLPALPAIAASENRTGVGGLDRLAQRASVIWGCLVFILNGVEQDGLTG